MCLCSLYNIIYIISLPHATCNTNKRPTNTHLHTKTYYINTYYIGQAPRYLRDLICLPSSAISFRLLHVRSLDRQDLFVPRARGHPIQPTASTASICPHRKRQQEFPTSDDVSRHLLVLSIYIALFGPSITLQYIANSLAVIFCF